MSAGASYPLLSPTSSRSLLELGFGGGEVPFGAAGAGGELLRSVSVGGQSEMDKPLVVELAVTAMEELILMAQLDEPLWLVPDGVNSCGKTLNEEEYARVFPRGIGPKPFGLMSEASRETAVVIMNQMNVVEMLMDVVIN